MFSVLRHPNATVVVMNHSPCATDDDFEATRQRLIQLARASERLIVDCSGVRHFGAAFLGVLLSVTRRANARPGDVVLCGLSPLAREVLALTCLDTFWPTYPTAEDALRASPGAAEPRIVAARPVACALSHD